MSVTNVYEFNSDDVFVFPSVKRGVLYSDKARILSEEAISQIVCRITDNEGYVITTDIGDSADSTNLVSTLKFILNGHYFEFPMLDLKQKLLNLDGLAIGSKIWASIGYQSIGNVQSGDYELNLISVDEQGAGSTTSKYKGVIFGTNYAQLDDFSSATGIAATKTVHMPILQYVANNVFEVIPESRKRLIRDHLNIDVIDGGEL